LSDLVFDGSGICCSESGIAISETNTFFRCIESWEYDGIVLRIGVFYTAIDVTFIVGSGILDDVGAFLECGYIALVQVNVH